MIKITHLVATYGDSKILRDLSLHIKRGEFAGILGPNGSGKTTLIRALSGVLVPKAGSVCIADQNIQTLSPRKRARLCATVPQKYPQPEALDAKSLVLMGRYAQTAIMSGYSTADHNHVQAAMHETQCATLAKRGCQTLSGGELQRVVMAKALAQDADLLLLDEAASHLDVARTLDLYELLRTKNAAGRTVVSVAHDLNLAALYCQRLIFLKNGQIAADGPTSAVFTAQILSDIYETPIAVAAHPVTGSPQAYLLPRS